MEPTGRGQRRSSTKKEIRAKKERERERGESNLNRNSDRYLWKLTGLEVNRGTETLSSLTEIYVYV